MAFAFSGARIDMGGQVFQVQRSGVRFSIPEPEPADLRAGRLRIEVRATLDTRTGCLGRILAIADQERALAATRRTLRAAGLTCRAIWIGDDLSWRVGRSGDVVAMLDDLGIPAVL